MEALSSLIGTDIAGERVRAHRVGLLVVGAEDIPYDNSHACHTLAISFGIVRPDSDCDRVPKAPMCPIQFPRP